MNPSLSVVDPTRDPAWNTRLAVFPEATVFHTAEWAAVLRESYGYAPVFVVERAGAGLAGVLPLADVRSRITGRRGVSLPFTDLCPPLIGADGSFDRLFSRAVKEGRQRRWKTIELRAVSGAVRKQAIAASKRYLGHTLTLDRPEGEILGGFRSSTRRNIQKAETAGVAVEVATGPEAVREFYHLNCHTRRSHGLPPQPATFFRALQAHVLQGGLGAVVLGRYERRTVAAAVFLHFNGQAVYKYGASDRRFQRLRANNLVMWAGIRWALQKGARQLHLGRTDLDHDGLRQFKQGWGTEEAEIAYARFDLATQRFLPAAKPQKTNYPVFGWLPMPLLRLSGQLLYRHIG